MRERSGVLTSILLASATAEVGVRLLKPRLEAPPPAPAALRSYFSEEEIARGRAFARPQAALALARGAIELGALALLASRPPRVLRQRRRPVAAGAGAAAALAVALSLPPLPLAVLSRRRAVSVGLVTQSWRGWALDQAKATGIEAVLAAAAGATGIATIRRFPRGWWALGAAGSVLVGTLFAALGPVLLDPIFNNYTPLPEGDTRSDVLELARDAGLRVKGIYSVDASRRTTAANAYVTGLGPTKRVVLFDTLLDPYSRDEVRVVVAHELAHVRHRDVPRGVLYAAIIAPGAAFATQRLSWALSTERDSPAALPALAFAAALVAAPIGLIGNRLSRAIERRADQYSLELTNSPDAFVSFERTIALQNVADLDPPRWMTALLATHPSTAERIGAALEYAGR
ncbi:MAG TPA: M48 family metalloprotease [Solirubrobacteraceae bacterium]